MYRLDQIWEQANREERGLLICDRYFIARGFKISCDNRDISVGKYVDDDLVPLDDVEMDLLLASGWVLGTILLSMEFIRRDIDRINDRIKLEMNGRKNGKFIKGLKRRRSQKIEVYTKRMKELSKVQTSTAPFNVEDKN
jgi:hypothetical protein